MTGIDTNVLVRLLVNDDSDQQRRAERYVGARCTADEPGLINRIVLVELVWVLEIVYSYERQPIARALERLVTTAEFVVDAADEVHAAIRAYADGAADFANCLIGRTNSAAGWTTTATFERRAARMPEFVLIEDDAAV